MTSRPTDTSPLTVAAALIRSRQGQEAVNLLIPYLKEHPQSEDGWLLLSFAVQDPKQKRDCLLRVLQINPNSVRAAERLAKLESVTGAPAQPKIVPQVQAAEVAQEKKRRRWVPLLVSLFVLMLLATLVVWGGLHFFPGWFGTQPTAAALQPKEFPTQTSFPAPIPTGTPSPTPTRTPTTSLTPTVSPTPITPTPTYDFAIPTGDLAQEMDHIQNQVASIRGLGILADYPRYIVPPPKAHGLLSDLFLARYTRDEIEDEVRVMSVLGLVEPAYDLFNKTLNNIGEGLGGFFIPWTDEIFVLGEYFGPIEKLVYAHEYDHALADQHYHLEDFGLYPECIYETDRCLALTALVEGDATYLMYRWLQSYATEGEIASIQAADFSPIDKVISSTEFPPPYAIRETYFKYFDGQSFVETLHDQGGWEAVDQAYTQPPQTTEQILHPEKYLKGEEPVKIELIPLDETLGPDWRHLKTDTLGELSTQMLLADHVNYLVQIDPIVAAEAAAGWGGDQYQVYYRSKSNQYILVAQWRWDSQDDSVEFWNAMGAYLNRRYVGRTADETGETCFTQLNDHYSCIFRTSRNTLWIMAPDLDTVDALTSLYPEFRH